MPVRVPSVSGSASTAGACSTSTSGANDRSSDGGGRDEHRLREQRVVGAAGDDADADAVGMVGAGEGVDDVERIAPVEMLDDLRAQAVEPVLGQRMVDLAPPDAILRSGLLDDELVLRRAPGERAGVDDQRATVGQGAVTALQRSRVELGGRRAPDDGADGVEAMCFEASSDPGRCCRHVSASRTSESSSRPSRAREVFPQTPHVSPPRTSADRFTPARRGQAIPATGSRDSGSTSASRATSRA